MPVALCSKRHWLGVLVLCACHSQSISDLERDGDTDPRPTPAANAGTSSTGGSADQAAQPSAGGGGKNVGASSPNGGGGATEPAGDTPPEIPSVGDGRGGSELGPFDVPARCSSGMFRDPNEAEGPTMNPGLPCMTCHALVNAGSSEADAPTLTIPRHQGSVTLGAELDYVGVALAGYRIGRMREEASTGSLNDALATDAQTWLDVSAFVKPFKALSIYGNLRNVTGESSIAGRRPFGARPNAPRWLQVGAKLAF